MAFLRRAISLVLRASSFFVSLNSSFKGFTMFSIKIRVAWSALSKRTDSASALAFSASAPACRALLRSITRPDTVATRPPPNNTFNNSLHISLTFFTNNTNQFFAPRPL